MGGAPVTRGDLDFADVQGIVRFGHGKLTQAAYLLARVRNPAAARAWLRSAPVTSAVTVTPPPSTALQVALTAAGLQALGVPWSVVGGFSAEFLGGMAADNRARRLGDVGSNAPARWEWGAGGQSRVPHLVVMFFAEPGNGGVDAFMHRAQGSTWTDAFDLLRRLDTGDLGGLEPFGFSDGISQPEIDWQQARDPLRAQLDYTNVVALGEFLLGYRNEYGKYTDRPVVDADPAAADLLSAQDAPSQKDVGRNGTYLVMRQLRQDVRGFWQFVAQQSGGNFERADQLAAAFVGRTRAGEPLVPVQEQPIPGIGTKPDAIRLNQFTFDGDPAGTGCPFGAHVRRANPRNTDLPGHPSGLAKLRAMLGLGRQVFYDDLTSSVRYHRLLRRGREYGAGLTPAEALAPASGSDPERGLYFVCLNANISRQFEFLQNAWIMNTKFAGMSGESDPLLGGRTPVPGCPVTADFTMPQDGAAPRRVSGLPQFITVRGGAYFFLPGLRALRFFATERGA